MPPKKANTKAKATPAKGKAAAVAEPPATVTNSKGKEFETTAAATRPRRASTASADTPAPKVKKAAPAKKAAPKATKATAPATTPAAGKKRGRPAKAAAAAAEEDEAEAEPPKKRGRPANGTAKAPAEKAVAKAPKKAAARPAKAAPAVSRKEVAPPKKRGRPPRGGETTQPAVADEAAAEQLEDELVENAEAEGAGEGPSKRTSPKKKRGRPAKAKGKSAVTEDTAEGEVVEEEEVPETNGANVKQYWLMKAEQEDREETLSDGSVFNAKFTIDDLRAKGGPEPWDGVRNPTACKNMKDMKLGDLAFFYASGGKQGRAPGITGIMEVVKESEPDLSAFDESAPYYVQNAKMRGTEAKPRWFMVHVEFRKKLSKPVTLKELQKFALEDGVLSKMQEFNAARLSVSKVSEKEWNFIVDELIEGYEEDEALPAADAGEDTPMADADTKLPNGVKQTTESEIPTTDTVLTANTAPTSRPGSRAGSRAGSASRINGIKPASRPGSRAGSLQPPARSVSRGRSRTPGRGRAASTQPMTTLTEET